MTQSSCVLQDAINENADRGNAGLSVHTIGSLNHRDFYKVTQDKHKPQKSRRIPLETTQTAVEILKDYN